ncbi:MAG: hypothetical protein HY263_03300 [Chloroflexi bacterium]|nr:hypothetical protein [Chloroflexota bacterium]
MTVLLVAAAAIAGAGAVAALVPGDVRLGLIGLTASLVGAALIADPMPSPAVLAIRLTALLLAVVTLRTAAIPAATPRTAGERGWSAREPHAEPGEPRPGWLSVLLLGVAGAVAGLAIAGRLVLGTATGGDVGQPAVIAPTDVLSPERLALGVAGLMVAVALGPLLVERTDLRRSIAAVLAVEATILLRVALVPAPGVLEEVVLGTILVAVAAGGAMLTIAGHGAPVSRSTFEAEAALADLPRPATPGRHG